MVLVTKRRNFLKFRCHPWTYLGILFVLAFSFNYIILSLTQDNQNETTFGIGLLGGRNKMKTLLQEGSNKAGGGRKPLIYNWGHADLTLGKSDRNENQKRSKRTRVKTVLSEQSVHTILSRIRFPNKTACLVYGRSSNLLQDDQKYLSRPASKITIGLTTVRRKDKIASSYVYQTLNYILNTTSEEERNSVTVVIAVTDSDIDVRSARAKNLANLYREQIESGLFQIITPWKLIYPNVNYSTIHRTYRNSAEMTAWRSKLVLDFAFLFSYSNGISPYFLNLEDDVQPVHNFVDKISEFIGEFEQSKKPWNSLLFSSYLSIGRLWRDETLPGLIQFFLTAYKSQPVDFLMQYYDMIQLATDFGKDGSAFRRKPPLFHHIGQVSSKSFKLSPSIHDTTDLNPLREKNPRPVRIRTEMEAFGDFGPLRAYDPNESFFWAKKFKAGAPFDVLFENGPLSDIKRVEIRTGFLPEDDHPTRDLLLNGKLEGSSKFVRESEDGKSFNCGEFIEIPTSVDRNGTLLADEIPKSLKTGGIRCLRFRAIQSDSGWLVLRLFHVKTTATIKG